MGTLAAFPEPANGGFAAVRQRLWNRRRHRMPISSWLSCAC